MVSDVGFHRFPFSLIVAYSSAVRADSNDWHVPRIGVHAVCGLTTLMATRLEFQKQPGELVLYGNLSAL
jgi:hypothetical protein